ncbi:hypothetical protein SPSIL_052350 [Sporomusa silvacetica DSM 10669]|uniref:PIN domain-containing protein n=1 Tax=Sporomusa silvacetica DSM 10669 TaxID=1123289 RepID=A0ABZ3ITJ9_9FIRM|nr:hypothetical protein SPSIL_21040 [Sporomusa silvacetica DSM 10669]
MYAEGCKQLGISMENMIPKDTFKDKKSTLAFLEAAPSFCVRMRLIYDICNDANRDIHKNDFKDIAFLATAVPYCDVVITEKLWAHLLKKNKLDVKYNTTVTNSLSDLKNL